MKVYLDNAASTPLNPEVFEIMKPYMMQTYGNPSSSHAHGRKLRAAIEVGRKKIAEMLGCEASEILFTSGGTEANNTLLMGGIKNYRINHVISSTIEHHSVSHLLEMLQKEETITLHQVALTNKGSIDYDHLSQLLNDFPNALVSLMHANNEIGNLLDINRVADMCHQHNAYFHSDTVQSVGHYRYDLKNLTIHGLTASAHKFHGPQGVGFMYINKKKKIVPHIYGGKQEKGMRAGTESTAGIVGMVKALEIAYTNLEQDIAHIKKIKSYMIQKLKKHVPDVIFYGHCEDVENSLYTLINVNFPSIKDKDMMLFNLDMEGVSVSGGSACSDGLSSVSHVIRALCPENPEATIRFSFSKYTTLPEIDYVIQKIHSLHQMVCCEQPIKTN